MEARRQDLYHRADGREVEPPTGKKAIYIPTLAAYQLSPTGAEEIWTVGGVERRAAYGSVLNPIHYNSAPTVGLGKYVFTPDLTAIDLKTGRGVGEVKGDTPVEDPGALYIASRLPVPRNGGYL